MLLWCSPGVKMHPANTIELLWKSAELWEGSEAENFFTMALKKQKVEQKRTLSCSKSDYIWFPTNLVRSNLANSKENSKQSLKENRERKEFSGNGVTGM